MKKNLLCIWLVPLAILFSVNMHAQMTIGGKKEPEAFSVLELLNKGGLRLPQMTTAERDAFAVQGNDKGSGLTIYNKTTGCVEYWNKTRWVSLCDDTSVNALIAAENGLTAASGKVQLGGALLKPTTLTTTAANTLTIAGLQTGSGTDNVLVADANGVLKWVTRAQFGGDNLGNHTATQDLLMSSKNITGAANITASGTVTGANLTATTKTTTPAAQITTGAGAGKVAVSDASGNVTWTDPATIAAQGDNLGNHTATKNLEMSNKDINNISSAKINYELVIKDRTAANLNTYSIYRDNGNLGIYNGLKGGNDFAINETTRRTTVNNLAITAGIDGLVPAVGSVAVAADINGNVVWKPASSLAVTGDNLGNHTATQDLLMSSKNITGAANVTASGTVTGANITATTKTTTPAAQITTGAGLGKVAVSDASGNLTWTDPATIAAKGDNLGNHTATQDLDMSSKNINNISTAFIKTGIDFTDRTVAIYPNKFILYKDKGVLGIWNNLSSVNSLSIDETTNNTAFASTISFPNADASKILFIGYNKDAARIEHSSGYNLGMVSGAKTAANSGLFTWSNYSGAGPAQKELMRLNAAGNLGIGTASPTNTLHVKATADPVKIEGLTTSTNKTDVSLVVGADGVVKKAISAPPSRATYTTSSIAPGASETIGLTITPDVSLFVVQTWNACDRIAIATFTSVGNVLAFNGGQARNSTYSAAVINPDGDLLRLTAAGVTTCSATSGGDGGLANQFDFDIQKTATSIIITNRGNVVKTYILRQSEF
ncbi:hypothetical protein [Flavobacterium soyae]|uniref:hypothetical protein n=1 Tax=Flavobacterium soyae TaxID=2903098 RepID=UPI001E2DBC34|nr:hypothetical protein [Flavobacterium soyae]MCD9576978.1 hypothetical protein [Flavobacterium soyae]